MSKPTAIDRVVEIVGSQSMVAAAFDPPITPQAVQQWVEAGRPPADRVLALEKMTGGRVSRYELRPDIYGNAPTKSVEAA